MYEVEAEKFIYNEFPTARMISITTQYGKQEDIVTAQILVPMQIKIVFHNGRAEAGDITYEGVAE